MAGRLAAAVLLLCAAACSPEARPAVGGEVEHLALQPVVGPASVPEPRVARRLEVPEQLAPWEVRGADTELVERAGRAPLLRVREGARVTVPGPFDARTFQAVAVRGEFRGTHNLTLALGFDGWELSSRRRTSAQPDEAEQVQLFEFPELATLDQPAQWLQLSVYGPSFDVLAFELIEIPPESALGSNGERSMLTIAGEARPATGLVEGHALQARLLPERGDQLRFSFGRPEALRDSSDAAVLVLRLATASDQLERRFETARGPDGSIDWREVRVPLDDFAGAEVTAVFHVEGGPGGKAILALSHPCVVRPVESPPTVLLVTSDTHRADHVAAYRTDRWLETPAIDALAGRGVLFEDCYASTNVTLPSHVAMMTGLSPRDTGVVDNVQRLADQARTLAEAFRESGFATYAVVSAGHLGPQTSGMDQGFDRMAVAGGESAQAEDAWRQLAQWLPDADELPLFVWLHLFDAHWPYEPPGDFDRRYYPRERDPYDPALPVPDLPERVLRTRFEGLRDPDFPPAQYAAEITYLDDVLGRLLEHPRFRDGIVAFTSDHGEVFGHHGVYADHTGLWPDTLQVPLVLAWPGAPAGTRVSRPVTNVDLGRTLLDLAGLEAVELPGENLMTGHGEGGEADTPERPRFALHKHGDSASITIGRWSLVLGLRDPEGEIERAILGRHETLLFDRIDDPQASRDLSAERSELAWSLRDALVRWLVQRQGASLATSGQHSAESLKRLAALGYATDVGSLGAEAWIDPECSCQRCASRP